MTENELLSLRIRELETWRQECKDVGERLIATDRDARKECDRENSKPYFEQNPPLPLGTTFGEMFARALKEGSEKVICDIAHAVSAFAGEYPTEDSIRQMQPALLQPHLIKCIRERGELLGKCLDLEKENDKLTRQKNLLLKAWYEMNSAIIAAHGLNDPSKSPLDTLAEIVASRDETLKANAALKEELESCRSSMVPRRKLEDVSVQCQRWADQFHKEVEVSNMFKEEIEAAHKECREVRDKYNALTHEFMEEQRDKEKAQWERDELQKWKESALTKSISGTAAAELVKLRKENKELNEVRTALGYMEAEKERLISDLRLAQMPSAARLRQIGDLEKRLEQMTADRDAARLQAERLLEAGKWIPISTPPTASDAVDSCVMCKSHHSFHISAWNQLAHTATHWCRLPALPKEEKKEPVTQWRLLNVGEAIKEGDELWKEEIPEWVTIDNSVIGHPLQIRSTPCRRKLP